MTGEGKLGGMRIHAGDYLIEVVEIVWGRVSSSYLTRPLDVSQEVTRI